MKKVIISGVFCSVLLLGGFQVASAETTTTTSNTVMLAKIQDLMKLIADLQAKLAEARGEIKELMSDLSVGDENEDVMKIQELLASDPTIFKVKPTGYFGPLTEEAIKKFQERYGLPVTGIVDEATREVMKELRKERKDGRVPLGLVNSGEVKDRIKARLQEKWGDCVWGEKFRASDCQKGHDEDDDEDEDEDEDEDDDDNASSTDATRDDAKEAILDAKEAIDDLEDDIEEMEDDDADDDDIEDAEDVLDEAEKELNKARQALARGDYDDAVEAAEKAEDIVNGDEDDDDDEDEDEDDDDDDEDDEDEDDDEDEEDDD